MIERPHEWPSVGGRGCKGDEIQTELLLSCDALLMGRRGDEIASLRAELSGPQLG